jgi:thiol:disulfide interchange protein DsbD
MERLKQLFAFPMLAAAVWLLWVLAAQAGPNGVLAALALMIGVAFAVWAFRSTRDARALARVSFRLAGAAALLGVLALVGAGYRSGALGPSDEVVVADSEPWSAERVAELRAEGRPVFVDFTAAWCVTCQANKLAVLNTRRVQSAFADAGVVQLVADWTSRDDRIAAELARYGRSGVPLYLMFPPEGDAIVLNEILSQKHVLNALARAKAAAAPGEQELLGVGDQRTAEDREKAT